MVTAKADEEEAADALVPLQVAMEQQEERLQVLIQEQSKLIADLQATVKRLTTADCNRDDEPSEPVAEVQESMEPLLAVDCGDDKPALLVENHEVTSTTSNGKDDEEGSGDDESPHRMLPNPMALAAKVLSLRSRSRHRRGYLAQTIYSLMYIAPMYSSTFLYAFGVFSLQAGMVVLVLLDQINLESSDNPFSIPAGVSEQVTAAQAACMVLAVALQEDFIMAVNTLNAGHDALVAQQQHEGATHAKFVMANLAQLLLGLAQLVATFALVMSSGTVIDVFLNFAGLSFISVIDDVGFALAAQGYATKSIQRDCRRSQQLQQRAATEFMIPRLIGLVAIGCLMAGFCIALYRQLNGYYLCSRIYVQFGDQVRLEYGGHSGEYVIQRDQKYGGRFSYLELESLGKDRQSMFAYCAGLQAWTHSSWSVDAGETPNPCFYWKARSAGSTDTYDLLATSTMPWLIIGDVTHLPGPLDRLYMVCNDCKEVICREGQGFCQNNECVCQPGHFGLNCILGKPCERIQRDASTLEYAYTNAEVFTLLRHHGKIATHRNHPVYVYLLHDGTLAFKAFTGRRWVYMYDSQGFLENEENLYSFLTNDFHFSNDNFFDEAMAKNNSPVLFQKRVSEPVDVDAQSYGVSPVGLRWHAIKSVSAFRAIDQVINEDAVYLCSVCDRTSNPCRNLHEDDCDETGKCHCRNGYNGALCEDISPCDDQEFPCLNTGSCSSEGICVCSPFLESLSTRFYGGFCELDTFPQFDPAFIAATGPLHNLTSQCGCYSTLQAEYRGTESTALNGEPCIEWGTQDEQLWLIPEDFADAGLEANYCRNLFLTPYPSCYVNATELAPCAIPSCPSEICPNLNATCGCSDRGADLYSLAPFGQQNYRGTVNTTKSGRSCQRWDQHSPHEHLRVTPELLPDAGLERNYCRNPTPDAMETAWCYTTDPDMMREPCDVPKCPPSTCIDPLFDVYNGEIPIEDYFA